MSVKFERTFKKPNLFLINDYLNVSKHRSGEYKISFKDLKHFYKDVKNQDEVFYWFGDGLNDCDIELASIVSCFIRPYLPPYTKLILKTIYLKYQRQERPTHDCPSSFLQGYIKQLAFDPIRKTGFDIIEVPHIHGEKLFDILRLEAPCKMIGFSDSYNVILPDQGAKSLIKEGGFFYNCWNVFVCDKERDEDGKPFTVLPEITNDKLKFVIIDDIIAGGDSIVNVINLLVNRYAVYDNVVCDSTNNSKEDADQRVLNIDLFGSLPEGFKIEIHCIFLMSDYGYNNIKNRFPFVEIKPIFDLRNFKENL